MTSPRYAPDPRVTRFLKVAERISKDPIFRRKLTNEDVREIRRALQGRSGLYPEGPPTVKQIAEHFGVSRQTVYLIKTGRIWKNEEHFPT